MSNKEPNNISNNNENKSLIDKPVAITDFPETNNYDPSNYKPDSYNENNINAEQTICHPPNSIENTQTKTDSRIKRCICKLDLSENTTFVHLVSYLLSVFFSICFVVFLSIAQPTVLSEVLNIKENLGNITGDLGLYDEIMSLFTVVLTAFISDYVGRKYVYFTGFLIVGGSLSFYTFPKSLYPGLLLIRLLFSVGAATCTSLITAGLGDLVKRKNGLLSGITGTFSGLGALLAVFVLYRFFEIFSLKLNDLEKSIRYTFIISGTLSFMWSIILLFTYKNTHINENRICTMRHFNKQNIQKYINSLKVLCLKSIKNVNVLLGLISGFVARGDTIVINTFITLFTLKFYQQKDKCKTGLDLKENFEIRESCIDAYKLGMKLSGISQTMVIVGALISGILIHKCGAKRVLLGSSVIAFIGYFGFAKSFAIVDKPLVILWIVLIGLGEAATIVTSLSLLSSNDNIDQENYGKISGIYSLFGCFGVMVSFKIGGILFDNFHPGAPFELMGYFHVAIFVLTLIAFVLPFLSKIKSSG